MKKRKEIDAPAASWVSCTCEEWAFAVGVMGRIGALDVTSGVMLGQARRWGFPMAWHSCLCLVFFEKGHTVCSALRLVRDVCTLGRHDKRPMPWQCDQQCSGKASGSTTSLPVNRSCAKDGVMYHLVDLRKEFTR